MRAFTSQPGGIYDPDLYYEPGEVFSFWLYDVLLFCVFAFFGLMAIGLGHANRAEGKRGSLVLGYGIGLGFLWTGISHC